MSSITSAGFSACICEGWNQLGFAIAFACNTHVDAFWSNSDQNGVTSAKSDQHAQDRAHARDRVGGMFVAHGVELQPNAETAECDHCDKRETGGDDKSEFRDEQERSDRGGNGDRGENLAAHA